MSSRQRVVVFLGSVLLMGCTQPAPVTRESFISMLTEVCRQKLQTRIAIKEVDHTVWIYLPYTPGRQGRAASARKDGDLLVEYSIASFNPFKPQDPPELRILIQKVLGEARKLLLRVEPSYEYFVLVVTNISDPQVFQEDWYIGKIEDVRRFQAGADFAGEGYNRLAWYPKALEKIEKEGEDPISAAYQDVRGEHLKPYPMTLDEFVERQITWRVYRQFTLDYGKVPFDMSRQEKQDAVLRIVKTVFMAYNYKGVGTVHLRDSSFLQADQAADVWSVPDLEKLEGDLVLRKPGI